MIGLMALVMLIEFSVIPEQREAFVAVSAEQVETIRAREGNLDFDILVDPKQPGRVVYIERWETAEQQEAFYQWWIAQGLTERLAPYVAAAPKISTWETID